MNHDNKSDCEKVKNIAYQHNMGTEEEEEEEYLVHVEFDSLLESDTFRKQNLFFKVIGIDTEKPIMQIGDQVFIGQYQDIPGTSLFFEEDDSKATDDTVFAKTAEKPLRYKYKTRKALVMRRVFIKKKDTSDINGEKEEDMIDEEIEMNEHTPMDSESLAASELGMEVSGDRSKEDMCSSDRDVEPAQNKQTDVKSSASESDKEERTFKSVRSVRNDIEPVAGPSWAPDIVPADCEEMFEESSVNADEMSRLIAEQMTLESDIKMQNSGARDAAQ